MLVKEIRMFSTEQGCGSGGKIEVIDLSSVGA